MALTFLLLYRHRCLKVDLCKKQRFYIRMGKAVYIKIPFERYYMDESKAKLAEEEYNKSLRDEKDVYATVRIHNGDAVVDGLYIDGYSIEDYLRNQ